MALVILGGNFGGTVGSNIFLSSQAPSYPLGYGLSVSVSLVVMLLGPMPMSVSSWARTWRLQSVLLCYCAIVLWS